MEIKTSFESRTLREAAVLRSLAEAYTEQVRGKLQRVGADIARY